MNWQIGLTSLICAAMCSVAHAQKIPEGTYVYQGGNGELRIQVGGKFSLDTVGGNAHVCNLEGVLEGTRGLLPDSACIVTFSREGGNIKLTNNGHDACRDACGVRAGYTGMYFKPTPACTPKSIANSRKIFKSLYDKKAYSSAAQVLMPVLVDCTPVLHRFDQGFVRNDLALAQLRSGDAPACLRTLQPLNDLGNMSDEDLRQTSEPAYVDVYLRLARATRTNLKLCNSGAH